MQGQHELDHLNLKINSNFIIPIAVFSTAVLSFGTIRLVSYWLTDDRELVIVPEIEAKYSRPPFAHESAELFREILALIPDEEEDNSLPLGESTYTIESKDIDQEDDPEKAIENALARKYGFTFKPDPEEPLYLFQEEAPFEDLVKLAQDQQALIEMFWSPIEENIALLDTLDRFESIDDFYELDLEDQSEPQADLMKLMRFHLYKAFLLVAKNKADEGTQLLTRFVRILRKTHPNTRSIISEMVVASSEIQLLTKIVQIATNTAIDRNILAQAYESSLPQLDPIENLERILLHEALVTHQLLNYAVKESRMSLTSVLVLPVHTSNLLGKHYQEIIALYRIGDFEGVAAAENRLVQRIQRFGIRNYYGKVVLQNSILMASKIAPSILETEAILDSHRQDLERLLN